MADQPYESYHRLMYEAEMHEVLTYLQARDVSATAAEIRRESDKVKAKMRGR